MYVYLLVFLQPSRIQQNTRKENAVSRYVQQLVFQIYQVTPQISLFVSINLPVVIRLVPLSVDFSGA
jgi:hypothetical protein